MLDLLTYFFSKFIFLQRTLKKRLFLAIHGSFLQVLQVIYIYYLYNPQNFNFKSLQQAIRRFL